MSRQSLSVHAFVPCVGHIKRSTCLLWHITAENAFQCVNIRYALFKTLTYKNSNPGNNPSMEILSHL